MAWLLLRDSGNSSSKPAQVAGATATTQAKLADLAAAVQHPIFWLGPESGFTYELTQTGSGKIYVRYLPHGVDKPYQAVSLSSTTAIPKASTSPTRASTTRSRSTPPRRHGRCSSSRPAGSGTSAA